MSRIHEALKKAQQERESPITAPPGWSVAVSDELAPALEAAQEVAPETSVGANGTSPAIETEAPAIQPARFVDWNIDPAVNVFHDAATDPQSAEHFRTLRSRLYELRKTQTLRTVLITSSIPAEGKTFVTRNLAQAIARQAERRVLMIDADLRSPRLHASLGAPNTPGLSDYLQGSASEEEILQTGLNGNLGLIPGGTQMKDPSEILSSSRFKTLIDHMTQKFDWVLLDSPPCLPVSDARVLADLADGILFVVRAASTPGALTVKARHDFAKRNVLGVVLNGAKDRSPYSSYYGSYGSGNHDTGTVKTGKK